MPKTPKNPRTGRKTGTPDGNKKNKTRPAGYGTKRPGATRGQTRRR